MKIEGFITNLGKYNEGELIGEWITFPIDEEELEEVLERIGINEEYEEYFFTDYENNIFDFGEYTSISYINEIAEALEEIEEEEEIIEAILEELNTEEAIEVLKNRDFMLYYGCYDMEDVAIRYVEETGLLYNVPDNIARYFDYEALGRDMDIEGHFIEYSEGYIEIIR
jgi:antirestriction protein